MNEEFVKRVISKIQWDPNRIALDIGAHHGDYTKPLSMKYKHVYAFEPFPENADALRANMQHAKNVTVVQKAISDKEGTTKLFPCPNNSGGNSINPAIAECQTWGHSLDNHIEVKTVSIDQFLVDKDPVAFIKMDIEGAEEFVWGGAQKTLKTPNLNIMLEVHQKVNCEKLFSFFTKRKFTIITEVETVATHFENDRHYLLYNGWPINL